MQRPGPAKGLGVGSATERKGAFDHLGGGAPNLYARWRPLVGGGQETERVAKARPEPCFVHEKGEKQR